MQAILHDRYGAPDDVLRSGDIAVPAVGERQILVRVRAASVHADIWHVATGWPYIVRTMGNGFRRPKRRVPGTDFAGVVEQVGNGVTRFRPGDDVFGSSGILLGWQSLGRSRSTWHSTRRGSCPSPRTSRSNVPRWWAHRARLRSSTWARQIGSRGAAS